MRSHNAFLGQKVGTGRTAKKYWDGKFFNAKTKEEYQLGVHTVIRDNFRAYDNMQQCFMNYYELLNTSLYSKVKADADYKTQMQQIKQCRYMSSSTEVNSVITIINKYDLTKYDLQTANDSNNDMEEYDMPTIKNNSKGKAVMVWQVIIGFTGDDVDGIFGSKTMKSTKVFQKEHDLKQDGIVGPKTWKVGLESLR